LLQLKYMFALAMILALVSTLFAFVLPARQEGFALDPSVAASIAVWLVSLGSVSIIYLERKVIGYKGFVKGVPIEKDSELLKTLKIKRIIPFDDWVLVEGIDSKLVGHAFARISDVPYFIDDLDREKKLWYVGNFVRILSTFTFTFEIIPRIMPISSEAMLRNVNKEIENLQLFLSSEGSAPDPSKEARLKYLRRLSERLLSGEGIKDVGYLAHVIAEGKTEEAIKKELDSNMRTLISALESGLGIRAEKLKGVKMFDALQEFFRASAVVEPSKTSRILTWDLAYLVPLAKPKQPPIEKLMSGVYLGRTTSGSIVCLDISKYANPHVMILGKSGYGKSTTLKTFASRFFDLFETPVLIIDYAGEYGRWVISRGGKVVDMRISTINPFELGHATLIDRVRQLVDAFHKNCDFKTINQRNAFTYYVMKAYHLRGFQANDQKTWKKQPPTLADVIQIMENEVESLRPLKQITVRSVIDRLQVLSSGPFGIFGPSTVSIEQIVRGFVSIDLSKVTSNSLKDMIAWTILQYIDSMMRVEGVREKVKLAIILDEAWKLCREEDSLPVAIIKEGRKYGYSLWISSQDATADLAESILANAGTVIIHHTEHPKYLNFFRSAYGLTSQELMRIQNLSIGEALIKLGDDPRPFFASIDMEEVEKAQKAICYAKGEKISPPLNNRGNIWPNSQADLSELEKAMMDRVVKEVLPITQLYKELGVDEYQGNNAKNKLIEKGLVKVIRLPKFSKFGRNPEALVSVEGQELGKKGGPVHRYMIQYIARLCMSRGSKVKFEHRLDGGKTVDLVIDNKIAVEVETGESDIDSNVEKLSQAQFEKRIIVCADRHTKQRVESQAVLRGITVIEPVELLASLNASFVDDRPDQKEPIEDEYK